MTLPAHPLLAWPHQVPSAVLHCLADADFIRSLELGPPQWWQQWQRARLAALLQWLGPLDWWQSWVAATSGPTSRIEALSGLPVMRREDYRALVQSHAAIAPAEHGELSQHHSSGSVGVPVSFWRTLLANRINVSHYWADHQRQGRNLHATMATITGTPGPHEGTHRTVAGDSWLHPGLQLARNAPQFTMQEHADWVCEHAPHYLATTPATLSSIISTIELRKLKAPRLAQVMTSSHTVEPELRARARRVLGASIRDRYSCEELGPLAFQCPESDEHYHVAVANVMLEVVDGTGLPAHQGQPGNVLVTGLHQWASPAVRYELGDIATLHNQCPACGATVPTLSQLLGRKYFLLNSKTQGLRHVRILAEHWLACAPVQEHRLVQLSANQFRTELVLEHPMTELERRALTAMLGRLVGTEFSFDLVQLEAIAWPASQKRQEFVGCVP